MIPRFGGEKRIQVSSCGFNISLRMLHFPIGDRKVRVIRSGAESEGKWESNRRWHNQHSLGTFFLLNYFTSPECFIRHLPTVQQQVTALN